MKLDKLFQSLLLTSAITLTGCFAYALLLGTPAKSEEIREANKNISQLSEIELPATSAQVLVQSPTPTNSPSVQGSVVSITGVVANPTDQGVEVILQTSQGKVLQPVTLALGKTYIANIPNAVLALPQEKEFRQDNPASGITRVLVTQDNANSIRVTVTGETGLPQVQLYDSPEQGLIFSFTPSTSTAQTPLPPEGETQPGKLSIEDEETIEILVTGEPDGYNVPDTSVGTRTDTPLRDIPQSIQVVPQQVLQDRQVRSITDGLENVSGVTSISSSTASRDYFTIRGFEVYSNSLVNGLPDPQITSDGGFVNLERLEVLKGPASVLYGETGFSGIGGTVNFVTEQPLRDPFYEISATIGSFDDYQGAIDFSGPLNDSKTALYRLNVGYRSTESFIDFNQARRFSIAPGLSFNLGKNTDLVIEGDVNRLERNGQASSGLPAVGSVLPNPNGRVRRSFNAIGRLTENLTIQGRIGYSLEHRFNENWKLRNAFRYVFADDDDRGGVPYTISPTSLAADNRTLNRSASIGSQFYYFYYLDTNLLRKFSTGSINHQLLFGLSLSRNIIDVSFEFGIPAAPVDIFNPVYDQTVVPTGRGFVQFTTRDTLGIYLQDQITFAENFKLLLGGRVDILEERKINRLTDIETSQSDTAFSPRVGIVYQPIPPISLYASFARSFAPTIGTSATGAAFQPERGTQYEVGIKADVNDRLSATIAFYDLTRSNVTTDDPDPNSPPGFSVQTGEQKSQGIELDISGEILPGWNIIGGYAYTDARVTKDNTIPVGNRLFFAPEHSFNLWTTYRIQNGSLQGMGFGLGFYYVGDRPADLANTFEVPSYFRTDAAIFYEREQLRAALNFRNLFNVDYYQATGSGTFVDSGEPFTVLGTILWQF